MMSQMLLTSPDISANAPITKTSTRPPLYLLSAVTIGPSEPGVWLFKYFLSRPMAFAVQVSIGPAKRRLAIKSSE